MLGSIISPESQSYRETTLISDCYCSSVFRRGTILRLETTQCTSINDHTDSINSPILLKIIDCIDCHKTEALCADRVIIANLINGSITIESYAEVIRDACELFVGYFNTATRNQIDFVLFNYSVVIQSELIEESSLDLSTLVVDKFYVQNVSSTFLVGVISNLMLLSDSSLDLPVEEEGV